GVKFKDADLIGVPYRVNIGDKGLADGKVEVVVRDTGERIEVTVERLVDFVCDKIEEDFKRYSSL
ncbi:MAG: proline--tRNA ligase, partial [Spirochaetes bacterium]